MNFYEDENLEGLMEQITDTMGYIILEIIKMSLKKIQAENVIYEDFLETKLEVKTDNKPRF